MLLCLSLWLFLLWILLFLIVNMDMEISSKKEYRQWEN